MNKRYKMRPGEEEDFARWASVTSGTYAHGITEPVVFLSQPSSRFAKDFTPPDYLIDGLLQRRFIYSMTAPTGHGKTAIALLWSANVALGRPIDGRETTPGRVLYFAGENPDDVRMRWLGMAEHLGFNADNIRVRFIPGAYKLSEIAARIRQEVEHLGGAELIVVDTSAAFFDAADENDNKQMGDYARSLRSLTTLQGGPTVLVLCHPVKNASADNLAPRGGGAFVNEMDGNLVCIKDDRLVKVGTQVKFRGVEPEPIPFELELVKAAALRDGKDRPIPTIIAKPVNKQRQADIEASARSDEDAVLITIHEHDGISVAGIAEHLHWRTDKGEPRKSKVQSIIIRLQKAKLVDKERGVAVLTEKGKKAAKKAEANKDMAGAKYG
jgi:hypothetical protein